MPNTVLLLYSTFPTSMHAHRTARILVEERLVACCNIFGGGESIYRWEDALTTSTEHYMLCKTTPEHAAAASARIASLHPHQCPAILTLETQAFEPFAAWVMAETMPGIIK